MVRQDLSIPDQLRAAIVAGDVSAVRQLIEAGADINAPINDQKWTPLHLAVECEFLDVVQCLLDFGADVGAEDASGFTPLHLAVDVEADGAIQRGKTATPHVSKRLMDYGADSDVADAAGVTPRALAEGYCYTAFLELTRRG